MTGAGDFFWPADQPLPNFSPEIPPMPCPKCRRIRQDSGARAVEKVCKGQGKDWFHCRCCGHRWPLGVKKVF